MSKSDEIRRMREQQHAQRAGGTAVHANRPAPAPEPAPDVSGGKEAAPGDGPRRGFQGRMAKAHAATEEQGKCSACGKVRGLVNGLIVTHQKGLGKVCPGSRKEPAGGQATSSDEDGEE